MGFVAVTAASAVADQQAPAAAVLTRTSVGAIADQQAAVLTGLITVADENPHRGTEQATQVIRPNLGQACIRPTPRSTRCVASGQCHRHSDRRPNPRQARLGSREVDDDSR
jgi:hypothetical protein